MSAVVDRIKDALSWRWNFLRIHVARGVIARAPKYRAVFATWKDFTDYARVLLTLQREPAPRTVRPKALRGQTVGCRAGTSDPWVLWDVFYWQFQSPPPEVTDPRSIVDLGANVGYTAAYFASKYPTASVLAVEMDGDNYAVARSNLASFGERCQVVHAAVWDSDGDLEYEGVEEQGFRIVPSESAGTRPTRRVRSRGLDSLFREFRLDSIDFVKMDIEGAEHYVLQDARSWLGAVRALKIELHPPASADDCSRRLEQAGFSVRLDDRHDQCIVAVQADTRERRHG